MSITVSDRYICYNEPEMRNSFGILRRKQAVDRSGIRGVVKSVCRAKNKEKTSETDVPEDFLVRARGLEPP